LFRSGSPLTTDLTQFNWTGITDEMKYLVNQQGIIFPNKFTLYDISLLNPNVRDDELCLNIEKQYFVSHQNETYGSVMYNYVIYGESIGPDTIHNKTTDISKAISFPEWSQDQLPTFIHFLELVMIQDFFKQPSVILIHCMQGVDRTGEITGAYEMKRFGKSVKEIIYQDTVINNGHPAPKIRNLNALLWYDMCINYGGC
jgi:hypothetical protein